MEDLLLDSFAFFFFGGVIIFGCITLFSPETPNRPDIDWHDNEYDTLTAAWEKTKEAKDFYKRDARTWVFLKYWFYIMLAHGAIFCIWLFTL
jgi:hypothetical protein